MEAALPSFLTLAEAAELLNCSTRTIRRLIASGTLPAQRIGDTRSIRLERADVLALLRPVAAVSE